MTTVAFKDGILVADTQVTEGNWRCGTVEKIHRVGRLLVGYSGSVSSGQKFRHWVKGGMEGDSPIPDDGSEGFVVSYDGSLIIWNGKNAMTMAHGSCFATGSGKQFAMGAMLAGASAMDACRIASQLDVYTNDQFTVLRL